MPIYLPTSEVMVPTVIRQFADYIRAMTPGLEDHLIEALDGLSLKDVLRDMRVGTPKGIRHYQRAIEHLPGFAFTEYKDERIADLPLKAGKGITKYVPRSVDPVVIGTWKEFLQDVAMLREFPNGKRVGLPTSISEDYVLDIIIQEGLIESRYFGAAERYMELHKRKMILNFPEHLEFQRLVRDLHLTNFERAFNQVRTQLEENLAKERLIVAKSAYMVPRTDKTFATAFAEIEHNGPDARDLYERLVEYHNGLEFQMVA